MLSWVNLPLNISMLLELQLQTPPPSDSCCHCKCSLLKHRTHFFPVLPYAGTAFHLCLCQGPHSVCLAFFSLQISLAHQGFFPLPPHVPSEGSSSCMLLPQGFSRVSAYGFHLTVHWHLFESLSWCLLLPEIQCFRTSPILRPPTLWNVDVWAYTGATPSCKTLDIGSSWFSLPS